MTKRLFIFIALFYTTTTFSQKEDSLKTRQVGIFGSFDLAYNFPDKILTPGLQRKCTIGLSLTNKSKQFIAFAGIGIKGAKFDLYSQSFRASFIKDIQQNYIPIADTNESRLVASIMNSGGKNFWGTYSQHAELGFMLNSGLRPSFFFFFGSQEFLLHDDGFKKYEDPVHSDINYVGMRTTFYEFKIGCGLPAPAPYSLNINVGYKRVNYGELKFNDTPLSAYTGGSLKNKYGTSGGLTISLTLLIWSNYKY